MLFTYAQKIENFQVTNIVTFFFGQVWIHGGAFRHGYSGEYEGSNFVAVGDVILVTINYRLTALGFLTSGDNRIKGTLFINHNLLVSVKECE